MVIQVGCEGETVRSQSDPKLSSADYLTALIHEHQSLRSEIQSTISSRNSGMIALAVGLIGIAAKVYPFDPKELQSFSAHVLLLIVLPALLLGFGALQAFATGLTERVGLAAEMVETKVRHLFDTESGDNLREALHEINNVFKQGLEGKGDKLTSRKWYAPLDWEHLVRGGGEGERFFDRPFLRPFSIMAVTAVISMAGPTLLWWDQPRGHWQGFVITAAIYILDALAVSLVLMHMSKHGVWKSIRGQNWL
jgi:hypothetical protein